MSAQHVQHADTMAAGRHVHARRAPGRPAEPPARTGDAVLAATVALLDAAVAAAERSEADEDLVRLALVAGREASEGAALLRRHLPEGANAPRACEPADWVLALTAAADDLDTVILSDPCGPTKLLDLCFAMYHVRTAASAFGAQPVGGQVRRP